MNDMTRKSLTYVAGTLILLTFAGFSYSKFTDALTPYVSYEKAIAADRAVQVAGGLQAGTSSYDDRDGLLRFTLVDPEDPSLLMPVRYEGLKPANFEDAISIVAIGRYDQATEEFAAKDLLVKCPSKYQGVDGYEEKSYSESGEAPAIQAPGAGGYAAGGYAAGGYAAEASEPPIPTAATSG